MQKARRHHISWLRPLVGVRFQVLFHPVIHGTFHLSFTVLVQSVSQEYLALPDGAGNFKRGVSDPALLRIPLRSITLHLRGYHPLWPAFPYRSIS